MKDNVQAMKQVRTIPQFEKLHEEQVDQMATLLGQGRWFIM